MGAAVVILAGGRATRLGGVDKPLLPLPGGTILDRALHTLRAQSAHIAISANGDPSRFPPGIPVLPDADAERPGPLAGVLAAMRWAAAHRCALVVTVPGDCPFLPDDLVARLVEGCGRATIACAASGGRTHPVAAAWPVALHADLEAALRDGVRKVGAYAARHGAASVEWVAGPDPFLNVNTPDDLAAARARLTLPSAPRSPAGAPKAPPPG